MKLPAIHFYPGDWLRDAGIWTEFVPIPLAVPKIPKAFAFSGVYVVCDKGVVLYVGESKNVQSRLTKHIKNGTKKRFFFKGAPLSEESVIWILAIQGIVLRLKIEKNLISSLNPSLNIGSEGIWRPE